MEASILVMFAAGMTLVYAGLARLFAGRRRARAAHEAGGSGRDGLMRGTLLGVALAVAGVLVVSAAVSRLLNP
ncbi:MAG TPA: hypothetical protein VFX96_10835 [Pyrinomonadaceae bacterium]|nr:hypothetical protein [Pyrinomonadaceae bacterium]